MTDIILFVVLFAVPISLALIAIYNAENHDV